MKTSWTFCMAVAKCAFLVSVLSGSACAETLGQDAMGSGKLDMLLRNDAMGVMSQTPPEKQPYLILAPSYGGTVSLDYHRGIVQDAIKKRDIHFDAFTRATAHYDEPDCPKPRLPAIFEFIKDIEGKPSYGEFAFFAKSIPSVQRLSACKTLDALKSAIPGLVSTFDEDSPHAGVWYNWFTLTNEGKLHVILLKARNDERGRLTSMYIWDGNLSPQKPSAIWNLSL